MEQKLVWVHKLLHDTLLFAMQASPAGIPQRLHPAQRNRSICASTRPDTLHIPCSTTMSTKWSSLAFFFYLYIYIYIYTYIYAGQATLLNLVFRDYIHFNMFDQAVKLCEQTKSSFPAEVSNNQAIARKPTRSLTKQWGRLAGASARLLYIFAKRALMFQVPANTCIGFRLAVSKLIVIVQLLMVT